MTPAQRVIALHRYSGAGVLLCRQALIEAAWDQRAAAELLKKPVFAMPRDKGHNVDRIPRPGTNEREVTEATENI
jgi:translation elongation factor EF-Ts